MPVRRIFSLVEHGDLKYLKERHNVELQASKQTKSLPTRPRLQEHPMNAEHDEQRTKHELMEGVCWSRIMNKRPQSKALKCKAFALERC